jgi:hypothetical protein
MFKSQNWEHAYEKIYQKHVPMNQKYTIYYM